MIPDSVQRAKISGDSKTLSKLGTLGAKRRRDKRETLVELRLRKRLHGSALMRREAHEDICPVDE